MAGLIIALDYPDRDRALKLVDLLGSEADFYKVGLELFSRWGPDAVSTLRARGKRVFLDLKLHDIPNTVAGAVRAAAELGTDFLTVHGSGGRAMLEAAVEASQAWEESELRILAVTALTSLDGPGLGEAWGRDISDPRPEVLRLARLATDAGVPGVVASAQEAAELRSAVGGQVTLVTPGIRLPGGEAHDQARVTTPSHAVQAGADYLVVGRAITAAADPSQALAQVQSAMSVEGEGP